MLKTTTKILFVANTSWYLYNFRLAFAEFLKIKGYEVVFVAPRDEYSTKLEQAGFRIVHWPLARKSLNPISEGISLLALLRIYDQENPAFCHHFTIKSVLYGSLAALFLGKKKVVNSVTGLGHFFLSDRLIVSILRYPVFKLYRFLAERKDTRYIFQNSDDQRMFENLGLVPKRISRLIRGSGIKLDSFPQTPSPNSRRILFASRLLREKGIYELIEAVRDAKREEQFTMVFAGALDEGNPSAIEKEDLQAWQSEGLIEYLGHVSSISEEIAKSDIVILPSYREGLPKILLEAAAMNRALIATDVPGCREIVLHEKTGLLVKPRDVKTLKVAILLLLRDPSLRDRLSRAAQLLSRDFSDAHVHGETLRVYQEFSLN